MTRTKSSKPFGRRFGLRRLGFAFALLALVVGGLMLRPTVPHAQEDQGVLAGFISKLLSTPTSKVNIGGVDGALSSDATIRDISIADADGAFLRIDRIRLVWRRAALLLGRIEVQNLEIGKIEFTRKPKPGEEAPPSDGPLLPEIPVKLQVDKFSLGELSLGETILGVAARFSAEGNASLGAPSEGLQALLDVRRLDAPGQSNIKLRFTPATQQLDLSFQHDEPAGGIVARLMGLPGLPPVKLDLTGAGVLDDWRGKVAFDAGPGTDARGEARLGRNGTERRLGLDLTAHIESLLPPAVGAIFAGTTTLGGGVTFADDGALGIDRLRLASDLAELMVAGRLDAAQILDVTVSARALPSSGGATRRGDSSLGRLVFDASAKGPVGAPRVDGKLDLAGLDTPGLKLQALGATLAIEPFAAGSPQRFRITMDGRATGVAPADRGLAEALGDNATLTVRATVDDKNVADISEARIATPNLAFGVTGRTGANVLDAKVQGDITRLAALSTIAGRRLAGRATVQVALEGDPSQSRVLARIDGRGTELSLGDAIADRLVGRQMTLTGTAQTSREGMTLDKVTATGAHLTAVLDGGIAKTRLDVTGNVTLADLAKLDPRLAGAARLNARVTGLKDDPDATLTLTAPDVRAQGRPIRDLRLTLAATRLVSAPTGTLSAGGDVNGKPLVVDLKGGAAQGGGWRLDQFTAQLGSVSAEGQGTVSEAGLASGRIAVSARDLDDITPLTLMKLSGALEASVMANSDGGRQQIAVTADGRRLVFGTNSINTLKADLRTEMTSGRLVLNGTAGIDQMVAGGETIQRIAFTARPNGEASDISLSALARGFNLAAAGKLGLGDVTRLDLATFTAARSGARIALAAPSTLFVEKGQVRTERLAIAIQGGEIELRGKVGAELDAVINARRVPLAAVDMVAPGTGLRGTLDARATLKGPAAAPTGPFEATIRGLSAPQTRSAGVPALDITARGAAEGSRANVDVRISGGSALAFTINGTAPLNAQGTFDLKARGTLDAGLANASLAGTGQRVAGRVAVDGSLRGTAARPDIQGTATLSNASFTDPLQGVALTGIEGRVNGRGDAIVIERLTARTKNGGTIAVTGRVLAEGDRGFPADIKISARNAQLVSSDVAEMIASLDLTVTGPVAQSPRLGGRIDITSLEIRVPDRLPSNAEPLRDARHVAPPAQTRARLAELARQRAASQRRRGGTAFNATLDLNIDAPQRIFVRGRGIDAELGGQLRVTGTSSDPRVAGGFELRRGRFSLLTQRLDFTRGKITFGGADVIPDLDFVAETRAAEVTARIAITGRATDPEFTLSSSPTLPQDEVLSRLLFARASSGLSPFQAVQLAQAVAQLAGAGGGPDAFERTRRAMGLNDLDVGMGAGGPTVGMSRNINDRVRVGVRAGARPENSAVGADIDLTRRLRLQSEVGADGRAAVGLGAEIEY